MRRVAGLVLVVLVAAGCSSSADSPSVVAPAAEDPPSDATVTPPAEEAEPTASATSATPDAPPDDGLYPTVVAASATSTDGQSWRFDVTLSSEYDSPERYADAWRVLDADDNELGIRVLLHDHAGEQPFTRSTTIDIAPDIATVYVEARDQRNGWNNERFEVTLAR